MQTLKALHMALDSEVRDVKWASNCGSEIFLDDQGDGEMGIRIGHFQGDAALAAFVVAAHNQMLDEMAGAPT